jgi:glycosyltransferase involved in cell wall biosynthesis
MIKVLLLDTGKEWGGGTNSLLELLKRIDRQRFAVTACFYHDYGKGSDSSISREMAALDIPFLRLPTLRQPLWAKLAKELARGLLVWAPRLRRAAVFAVDRVWRIAPRARAIAKLLGDGGYDLIYLNNQPASNLEGYLGGELAGKPVVQHCRIDVALNAFEIATSNRIAARIICVSNGLAQSLRDQGVDAARIVVVPNAIDSAQAAPQAVRLEGIPTGAIVIGTVGSLIKRKSIDHLIRALAVRQEQLHLLVLGEGPEEVALRRLASALDIAERVHFAGFQERPLPWLAAMDIFVLASAKEGLPRVVLEAMLLGKPVIASRVIGPAELVVPGETGFLYEYGDVQALASHIGELAASPSVRARFGSAGQQRVVEHYSIERYVSGVEDVLAAAGSAP